MAILSLQQIKELLEKPKHGSEIARARQLEERLKLHVESVMEQSAMQSRFSFFKQWVEKILPPDKIEGFCSLWLAPAETNELTESIFGELSRVFEADNPNTNHQFKDSDTAAKFEEYLKLIGDEKFWKVDYWEELKSDQNSYVIIDLPAVQATPQPAPYYYLLDNAFLIDVEVNKDGFCEYILFKDCKGMVIAIDSLFYYTFVMPAEEKVFDVNKLQLLSQVKHNCKRVPAKPMYFMPINKDTNIINHNPITKSLSSLDWLLFFEVARKFLETYAPYPIYATYEEQEDTAEQKAQRGENQLTVGIEHAIREGVTLVGKTDQANRNAANKRLTGPGTIQRFGAPRDNQDADLLSNPVQVIPAEEVSLNYCKETCKERSDEIFANCVGRGGDVLNDQAANELQVQSTFESRINVLSKIRQKIEECRKFVYETLAEMMFGTLFVGSEVSLGDEYFLTTPKDQQQQYQAAKNSGVPSYELTNQLEAIYKNKYRDQPNILQRNLILSHLEPYGGLSISEVSTLVKDGNADRNKFLIKLEFDALVKRFEREQMNVVDFASARPLQTKIDIIFNKLLSYVQEANVQEPANSAGEQNGGPGGTGTGAPQPQPLPATA